jgi:hypothetical protein
MSIEAPDPKSYSYNSPSFQRPGPLPAISDTGASSPITLPPWLRESEEQDLEGTLFPALSRRHIVEATGPGAGRPWQAKQLLPNGGPF